MSADNGYWPCGDPTCDRPGCHQVPNSFVKAAPFDEAKTPYRRAPVAEVECPTLGVCPNCREGWGHYYAHIGTYVQTVQSEAARTAVLGLPTPNARRYALEFAAQQLREVAKWCEANGYDDAAVDHLIVKAEELWPTSKVKEF